MTIEWNYDKILKLKSSVADRCGIPSKCGKYRISIFVHSSISMPTMFYGEVRRQGSLTAWDVVGKGKRLKDAIKACENHANGVIKVEEVKKSRRKRRKDLKLNK